MTMDLNFSQEIIVLQRLNVEPKYKYIYFSFTLIIYIFTIFVNLTLIFTICLEKMLHDPMYIFICNLCINGIYGASGFYPKILYDLLFDSNVITYIGCMTQIFVVYSYAFCDFATLTVMAYDRYVAICKPLHYQTIMTFQNVWRLILLTWLFPWLEITIVVILTSRLSLCSFDIDKIYCTNWAVVKLSCGDITPNNIYAFILICSYFAQFIFILISYVNIIKTSLHSWEMRRKSLETCVPHLITLTNFTLSITFDLMYARYGSTTSLVALKNIMSVEFLVVPPLLNPIIYGMKLTQLRNRVGQMFIKMLP